MENRRRKIKQNEENLLYDYKFRFQDGTVKEFPIQLDYQTLELISPITKVCPEWSRMETFMCENCPLDPEKTEYCPAACNLSSIIDAFKDSISYEKVEVIIQTHERTFMKKTSLQEGLSSIISISMVSSKCPILQKLKPMVRVHVPFATLPERKYRVLTMYLLAQYYIKKRGGKPDWDFKNLIEIFESVRIVNKNFCDKLSLIKVKDATINALVTLDSFAFYTSFFINKNMLNVLEPSFDAYVADYERRKPRR